ncbi:MAG: hypothetical protein JXR94_07230, partial [Candidatus Hydrogenedentes bacterium]|nr:hypothetical protein [Candidatus Hydrogenedentota bacterium]
EGSREGIEDWQIMRLYQRLADAAGPESAEKARAAVSEAVDTVLANKDDTTLAAAHARKLAAAAVALAQQDPLAIGPVEATVEGQTLTLSFTTSRDASGIVLYRFRGARDWAESAFAEAAEHRVAIELPPLAEAEWIVLAWDALGRVAVAPQPGGLE